MVIFDVVCSPTFTALQLARDVAIEPAEHSDRGSSSPKRRKVFSYPSGKGEFVSSLRIGLTSLVLTLLWVQQAHTQMASHEVRRIFLRQPRRSGKIESC